MDKIDENFPTIEIPSRVKILMINEQAEEIVIQDPEQVSPEQRLLMEQLVNVLKRAVETENTASGESQSAGGVSQSASGESQSASGESQSAGGESQSASGESQSASGESQSAGGESQSASVELQSTSRSETSASYEIPSAAKMKELEEGVHRAIKMTIEDPSYRSLRQSFSVEISYFNLSLNVNIDAGGNSN